MSQRVKNAANRQNSEYDQQQRFSTPDAAFRPDQEEISVTTDWVRQ